MERFIITKGILLTTTLHSEVFAPAAGLLRLQYIQRRVKREL